MKLILDINNSKTPDGWVKVHTVSKCLEFLVSGQVKELSVTHDLDKCINCGGLIPVVWEDDNYTIIEPFLFEYEDPDIELNFTSSSMFPEINLDEVESLNYDDIIPPSAKATFVKEKPFCPHVKNGYWVILAIEAWVAKRRFVPPQKITCKATNADRQIMMERGIYSIYQFHETNIAEAEKRKAYGY